MEHKHFITYAEIDLKALKHNFQVIRKLTLRNKFILPFRSSKPMQVLAVVKADAYGHGAIRIARTLDKEGVEFFGVSDVAEGIELRKAGIKKPILLFESTLTDFIKEIVDYRLTPTVCCPVFAEALNDYARRKRRKISVHIKIDTGMSRLGVWHEDAEDFVQALMNFSFLDVQGIYTHFPVADSDKRFTKRQMRQLYDLVRRLDRKGLVIPFVHAGNSVGLGAYQTQMLNLTRPGLMLYGLYPSKALKKEIILKPVMSVKSKVIFLKEIPRGRGISYGHTFVSKKRMTTATIPIGYHDGYLRAFSNKSFVIIRGARCPVLGNVTMDQIIVDVSKVKNPRIGMPVTVLGTEKNASVDAEELARYAKTIPYEIVCQLGNRLPRILR